jgi:hypothetical protein
VSNIVRRILPVSAVLAGLVSSACHDSATRVRDAGDDASSSDAGDAGKQAAHDAGGDAGQGADAGRSHDAGSTSDAASASDAGDDASVAPDFADAFDTFDTSTWSCEYTCPGIVDGKAVFALQASVPPDQEGSWSKIRYKPQRFTSGKFTVRFALSARPAQAVWWGVALWDDGPKDDLSEFNEINFGYTTDESFPNTQLRFESAKRGNAVSRKVDVGADLYDGNYHSAALEYDATHVALYFDGKLLDTITDTSVIPTDPVDYIIGPRLVTGSDSLEATFSESVDSTELSW